MEGTLPGRDAEERDPAPRDPPSRGTPVLQDSRALVDPLLLTPSDSLPAPAFVRIHQEAVWELRG